MLAHTTIERGGTEAMSLKIIYLIDELHDINKRSNQTITDDKESKVILNILYFIIFSPLVWEKSVSFLDFLCSAITPSGTSVNSDLFLDAALFLWETICPLYNGVTGYDSSGCKSLSSKTKPVSKTDKY